MTPETLTAEPLPRVPPSAEIAFIVNALLTLDVDSTLGKRDAKLRAHQAARIIATFCSPNGDYGKPNVSASLGDGGEDTARLDDCIEEAWGIIANANEGLWERARPEWREAAERWRDRWVGEWSSRAAARARPPAAATEDTDNG